VLLDHNVAALLMLMLVLVLWPTADETCGVAQG